MSWEISVMCVLIGSYSMAVMNENGVGLDVWCFVCEVCLLVGLSCAW